MGKKKIRVQYYINPFLNHNDPAIGNTSQKYAAKSNCHVFNPLHEGCLARIEDYSTLIIDGHGTDVTLNLSATHKDGDKLPYYITHTEMAAMIARFWKLPKTHCKIRLLACKGFHFAKFLAIELATTHEFGNICVAGYLHNVAIGAWEQGTGRGPNATKFPTEDDLYYEKDRICWFNGRGEVVEKPVFEQAVVGESDSVWN